MVSFPPPADKTSSNEQQDGADRPSNKPLDIIFLQDTTGSQGPYIRAATKAIRDICDKISAAGDLSKELIRFGLIAFRDHPPQDVTYITKNFGFTSNADVMQKNLASLVASGGGDGPEAQTAALADALNMEWAEGAVKMVILITDSPPHGLGERGDGFSESPDQNDPLEIVRQMAERGITLFVVACEPTLSQQYIHALDFYTALVKITSGRVLPLLMADKLGDYIVGTALETIDTEKLIEEFEKSIVDDVYKNNVSADLVADNLQQFMNTKGKKISTISVEDIYAPSETADTNRMHWGMAPRLASARAKVVHVQEPRIQAQYLQQGTMHSRPMWSMESVPDMSSVHTDDSPASYGRILKKRSRASGGGDPPPHPSLPSHPPPASVQTQHISMASQQVSQMQAQRIVQQSLARNSKVTPTGMVSKVGKEGMGPINESAPST